MACERVKPNYLFSEMHVLQNEHPTFGAESHKFSNHLISKLLYESGISSVLYVYFDSLASSEIHSVSRFRESSATDQ